jgi:hypothetical protein
MFFLNLSLPEFLAILGSLSGVVVALYLLDRLRKHHTVPTLRFFAAIEKAPILKHRRKLQQPWSLLLQLISLLLLLLAIAQLRLGSPVRYSRDHVLILDVSPWMAARLGPNRLIDQARLAARSYVNALPLADRVMVVRAGVLATPALLFESDRKKIEGAIDQTQPGAASLNLQGALDFAERAQRVQAERPGEIVFIGAARIPSDDAARLSAPNVDPPPNFRFISIAGPSEHVGLRKISVRRAVDDADVWEVFLAAKNYGAAPRSIPAVVNFGGSPVATHRFDLKPSAEESFSFRFKTRAAGWLEARLPSQDAFRQDAFNQDRRAILELPPRGVAPVTVYSAEPDPLRPVFTAIPGIQAKFLSPAQYDPKARTGIVLLDRFAPPALPATGSIWLDPPPDKSPILVRSVERSVKLNQWQADHPLGAGLRARDIELANAEIFHPAPGDITVARSSAGPLIVARSGTPKMVVLGFHPIRSGMKYQLTTPLLFANMVRWMEPDAFRSWELTAGAAGTVDVQLESGTSPGAVRVQTEDGKSLPFTIEGKTLRFFTADPGIVRVLSGDRELVYSLTLPQPGDAAWKPSNVKIGLPPRAPIGPTSRDLWQWLALAGAVGLLVDWILYGRIDRQIRAAGGALPGAVGLPLSRKAS